MALWTNFFFYAPGERTGGQTHGVGWGARNYHSGNGNGPAKKAGEQTDYGDYLLLMLEHLSTGTDMLQLWMERLKTWRSWIDTMTKATYQQVARGQRDWRKLGGMSNAMALRSAGALAWLNSEQEFVDATRRFMFTHQNAQAHIGGEFFARVAWRVTRGQTPRAAVDEVASAIDSDFVRSKVRSAIDKVAEAQDPNSDLHKSEFTDDVALTSLGRLWEVGKSEPIKVGKASPTEGTLPGSLYFILKYTDDLEAAMVANANVGGDNASRAMMIGMVLGAHLGEEAIPQRLKDGLVELPRVEQWLENAPLLQQANERTEL